MLMATFFYASLYLSVRQSVRHLSVAEVAFFRSALVTAMMLPWVIRSGFAALKTQRIGLYIVRAAFLYAAAMTWIYAVAHMPIADVTAILFVIPLITVVLTFLILGEKVGPHRMAALAVGFLGVLLILRPGVIDVTLPALVALASATLFAASHASARALGKTENANAMVFYLYALGAPMALGPALFDWQTPGWIDLGWLVLMAALTLLAQQGLTRALIAAPASVVMPLNFLQLPIVAVFGLVFYGEMSDLWTWIGAAVICGSSYYITWHETRKAKKDDPAKSPGAA